MHKEMHKEAGGMQVFLLKNTGIFSREVFGGGLGGGWVIKKDSYKRHLLPHSPTKPHTRTLGKFSS